MPRNHVHSCLALAATTALALSAVIPQASAAPTLDTIIILDGSGSIGTVGFDAEKNLAESIIETVLPSDSNAGAFEFGTTVTHDYPLQALTGSGATTLGNDVAAIPYVSGSTYDKVAFQEAIDQFTASSPTGDARLVIWLTDQGEPNPAVSQDPCSLAPTATADGIRTVVVEGNPTGGTPALSCLASSGDIIQSKFADFPSLTSDIAAIVTQEEDSLTAPEPSGLSLLAVALAMLATSVRMRGRRRPSHATGQ